MNLCHKIELPFISSSSGIWHFLPLNPIGQIHVTPASPICLKE